MKVTLDLDQLLAENQISQQEYNKLMTLSQKSTGSLALSILIGFGVIAVSGAVLALVPTSMTAILIGAVVLCGGIALLKMADRQWQLLAQICILVGALMLGGGLIAIDQGSQRSYIAISFIYAVSAIFAQSGLLATLAVLAIGPLLGGGTGYHHASYMLVIEDPLLTIIVFSVLGVGLFFLSKNIPLVYSRLAIIASRTCLFMINLGFWIGSLWGAGPQYEKFASPLLTDISFSIVWALALIATGVWAWHRNRRWVLNLVAVFGGIHFYTQWFEHLGASPGSVLMAGIAALIFALLLKHLNNEMKAH